MLEVETAVCCDGSRLLFLYVQFLVEHPLGKLFERHAIFGCKFTLALFLHHFGKRFFGAEANIAWVGSLDELGAEAALSGVGVICDDLRRPQRARGSPPRVRDD
jgi:hypothetical protein